MRYVFKKTGYRIIASLLDAAGSVIFFPSRLFKRPVPSSPKRILVVRLDHIGDFVCTTPIFKNLKKQFPGSQITALINSASKELAFRDPNIDKVISFSPLYLARSDESATLKGLARIIKDVKNIGFDLGIDPRGDIISILIMWLGGVRYRVGYGITGGGFLLNKEVRYDRNMHVVDRNLALLKELNIPIEDKSLSVYFNEKDKETVEGLVGGKGVRLSAVVLHPFAGAKAKEWGHDKFQSLIERLNKDNRRVILVGSKSDSGNFSDVFDIRGSLSLPQLACLIKRIGFFIGLDSGPANIAAALNVPSVIICSGTNVPQLWIPNNSNVKFVYKDIECKPCENKICPKKKHECMDQITVEEVLEKFKEIANRKMGQSPPT